MVVLRGNPNIERISNAFGQGLSQGYSTKMNDLAYQQMLADRQQQEQAARDKILDLYEQVQTKKRESESSPSSAMGGYDTQRRLNDEANALRTQLRQYGIDTSQIEENTMSGDARRNWNKNIAIEEAAKRYVAQNIDPTAAASKARNFVLGGGAANFDENMFNAANQYYRQQALGNKDFTTETTSQDGVQYAQDYMVDKLSGTRVPIGKPRVVSNRDQWTAQQQRERDQFLAQQQAERAAARTSGSGTTENTLSGLDVPTINEIEDKGSEIRSRISEGTITEEQAKDQVSLLARKYNIEPSIVARLMGFSRRGTAQSQPISNQNSAPNRVPPDSNQINRIMNEATLSWNGL